MSCFSPKSAVKFVYSDGSVRLKHFCSSNKENREKNERVAENGTYFFVDGTLSYAEAVEVPCGKCLGCRLDYARGWAERIMLETRQWTDNYFVTFTFDDDHLIDPSLNKKAFSAFLKRLREYWSRVYGHNNIRFFMCGEYGKLNLRKHYHVIFFNFPIFDLVPWRTSSGTMYTSDVIENLWSNGFVSIGDVTFNSAGYVARYTMKKASDFLLPDGRQAEFVNMSRKPGIGRAWFDDHYSELYDRDGVYMRSSGKVSLVRPAPYFDKLMKDRDPDKLSDVKIVRRILAISNLNKKMSKTTLSIDEQRLVDFENLLFKVKSLKRQIET